MPRGTKVHKCVDENRSSMSIGNAIAMCQASTGQSFATGKPIKKSPNKRTPSKKGGKK